MARYRRYKRKRSTNVVRMKFQSFMDISTNDSSMQIITVSAGGKEILKRLAPQFGAYKYFKIGAISVKLVPASTLPVDPSGLSYEAGENQVDPRDQLTPGMMRITNGEDVFENITGMTDAVQHGIYNNMLLDPRWFKWMLQSGTKRRAYPRYWQIGELHQDKWPGMFVNLPHLLNGSVDDTSTLRQYYSQASAESSNVLTQQHYDSSSSRGFFQTGHRGVLGWLPTDGFITLNGTAKPMIASPPEIEVMKIILPKAYSTRYYYRMFITEEVLFREPIVNFGVPGNLSYMYRPLDVFHYVDIPTPVLPSEPLNNQPEDRYTGGNYGNDQD